MKWEVATPFARRVLEVAARTEANLVGGAVRDLLLERPFGDVDLMTEGPAIDTARAIARELAAPVREYPRFLTAKIMAGREPAVDIATARKERYARPGALPEVSRGTVEEDLFRRDFTINAICLRLGDERVIDPFGGAADLRSRTLRVLHARSFIDDPTRILRGLRIGARLAMSFDDSTATLAREAIEGRAMETISRERHWRELLLAVEESDPAPAILAIVDSGAAERLTGVNSASRGLRDLLISLTQLLDRHPALDRAAAILGALYRGERNAGGLLAGSGFTAARRAKILAIAEAAPRAETPLEALAMDAVEHPRRREEVERRLAVLQAPLPFSGGELGVPPGPHIGKAMRRTRQALASGEVQPQDARGFARRLALEYLGESTPGKR